jgi:nicotinamide-nucleotide amidase
MRARGRPTLRQARGAAAPGAESMVVADGAAWEAAERAADDLVTALREAGLTVAVAESLTGGAACSLLTRTAGASEVVRGAVVAYATDLKSALLDVDAEELARSGPVTARVAQAMALGVRSLLGADLGLATTGEAGPESGSGAPVGTVFVAAVSPAGSWVRQLTLGGGREAIRAATVAAVLDLARDALARHPT